MKISTAIYYVEVFGRGRNKIMPHNPKKNAWQFLLRRDAAKLHRNLVKYNSSKKYRICKMSTIHETGPWVSKKIKKPKK